jgi:ABC-type sugar transport system permease subunit
MLLARRQRRLIVPLLAPALLLFGVFWLYPSVRAVYVALTEWDGVNSPRYIGFRNFADLLDDRIYRTALENTIRYTIYGAVLIFTLGLLFAWWTRAAGVRGGRTYRFIIMAPMALSVVTAALLFKFLLNPTVGPINAALSAVGLDGLARPWLADPSTALACIVMVTVWHGIGQWVILFGAGFARIPSEILDAARVDGASGARIFFAISLPLVWDVLRVLLLLWIVGGLTGGFGFVWAMTQGGPFNSTELLTTFQYRAAFVEARYGYAAAIAVTIAVFAGILVSIVAALTRRSKVTY